MSYEQKLQRTVPLLVVRRYVQDYEEDLERVKSVVNGQLGSRRELRYVLDLLASIPGPEVESRLWDVPQVRAAIGRPSIRASDIQEAVFRIEDELDALRFHHRLLPVMQELRQIPLAAGHQVARVLPVLYVSGCLEDLNRSLESLSE